MIGVTRGISTLAGAAVAGVLLWIATQIGTESNGEYWATYGVIAAAGLTMALSQLLGGWTKWGWPRFSLGVFLVGFLPVLVAGGWVLLARQPADWMNTSNWSRDLGIHGAVADVGNVLPAVAFGIGLVFGFSFDTAGPRREPVAVPTQADDVTRVERDADEPLTAERRPYAYADSDGGADGHDDADGTAATTASASRRGDPRPAGARTGRSLRRRGETGSATCRRRHRAESCRAREGRRRRQTRETPASPGR